MSTRTRAASYGASRRSHKLECATKRIERRVRVAFGEGDRAVGLRHHRAQHVGVERLRQLSQFIAGASGLLEISDRRA